MGDEQRSNALAGWSVMALALALSIGALTVNAGVFFFTLVGGVALGGYLICQPEPAASARGRPSRPSGARPSACDAPAAPKG